ncbi:MAG: hypothetical protein PF569_04220 [Candidatus Woesearchaeota archaeon]|jgi:hypothetical protein|nr:hypothetical protein [Candidatus Woesearchaeota archaeon]
MFDLILSFIVLILSVSLIYNYYLNVDIGDDVYELNKNILDGFTNTKINSLNNKEIRDMFIAGEIKNIENTVAQQVAEFYYINDMVLASDLTQVFVEDYLDKQMNFNLTIEEEDSGVVDVLFVKLNRPQIEYDDSSVVSSRQRIIFGFNNSQVYGPYIFKTIIWK